MDKKKKMHEELEEIAEKFACMPELVKYFKGLEKKIRYYNRYIWEEGVTKERLLQKQKTLMEFVKEIDGGDLQILFYLRFIKVGGKYKMLKVLKERYQAECNYCNELYQTQEKFDVCAAGEGCELKMVRARREKRLKPRKNMQKTL